MPPTRSHEWLSRIEWALLPLGVVAYLILPHGIGYGDGFMRYGTLEALMRGEISPIRYSIIQAVLAVPFYLAGESIDYPRGVVALFNLTVFIGALAAFAALLFRAVPAALLRRILLLLLAASMFGHHVQAFYGEVLTAVFVGVGLLCLVRERPGFGYPLLVVGAANTPATVPALFLALIARPIRHRLWHATWATAAAAALVMIEFYIRRGSPLLSGYERDHGPVTPLPYSGVPGFSFPFVFGVVAILFSFGKGLVWFMPGLLLLFKTPAAAPSALRAFQRPAVWFVVGLVAVYAKWWAWNGAFFWGPRFFLFACIPASVALAMHLGDERATTGAKAFTLAILSWSIWVAVDGVAIGLSSLELCRENGYYLESLCWYTVEFSPLFRPFTVFPAVGIREGLVALYCVVVGVVLALPLAIDVIQSGVTTFRRRQLAPI